jgi:hypothetical protein
MIQCSSSANTAPRSSSRRNECSAWRLPETAKQVPSWIDPGTTYFDVSKFSGGTVCSDSASIGSATSARSPGEPGRRIRPEAPKEPCHRLSNCSRSAGSYPGATSGPRSASSVSVPPEPEKTQELMRSHERLNRRSASISGKYYQVTESGVTEPGLQANRHR